MGSTLLTRYWKHKGIQDQIINILECIEKGRQDRARRLYQELFLSLLDLNTKEAEANAKKQSGS